MPPTRRHTRHHPITPCGPPQRAFKSSCRINRCAPLTSFFAVRTASCSACGRAGPAARMQWARALWWGESGQRRAAARDGGRRQQWHGQARRCTACWPARGAACLLTKRIPSPSASMPAGAEGGAEQARGGPRGAARPAHLLLQQRLQPFPQVGRSGQRVLGQQPLYALRLALQLAQGLVLQPGKKGETSAWQGECPRTHRTRYHWGRHHLPRLIPQAPDPEIKPRKRDSDRNG